MSRVSEALQRASEESPHPIPKSVDEREHWVEKNKEGNSTAKANGRSPLITLPEFHSETKPWLRERIEEFLFGWDLRSFKAHPLAALEKGSTAAEQYKILREQVRKLCSKPELRSLAVTSPIKGDGKTTVAVNLAAAIALDYEEQVLLIDADLRNPSIHSYFGVKPTPGLADYLTSNSTDIMSYVQDTSLRGLRILPAGKSSNVSSELLATERMKSLVKEIPSKLPGHLIIMDTSAILSTPDPLVLARQVAGIIVVIRAGKTPRDYLLKAVKSLGSDKLMGVILNGAELGRASKYNHRKRS